MTPRCLPARACLFAAILASGLSGCGDNEAAKPIPPDEPGTPGLPPVQITALSNRADLISGGQVLIELTLPPGGTADKLRVLEGTRDVTSAFKVRADNRIIGLVTGLPNATTQISADIDGRGRARLRVTNHPIGGPVFSGEQIQPWVCANETAVPEDGDTPRVSASGLPGTPDAQCNVPSKIALYYRSTTAGCQANQLPDVSPTTSCWKAFDPDEELPADVQLITSPVNPATMIPFVVRVERGTMNRGLYDIAVLADPEQTIIDHNSPPALWNGKLNYIFGQSTGQPRRQQRSSQLWTAQVLQLQRGFMVAMSNMTDSALNSNRVSMTETLMMMKEHIIESYGELTYTVGFGCSGGSINQMTAASIFPGLLDGTQIACTYPDSETTGIEVADCELLVRAYTTPEWRDATTTLTPEEQNALQGKINGHLDQRACQAWFNAFIHVGRPGLYVRDRVLADGSIEPIGGLTNNCDLPNGLIQSDDNPGGARCAGQDHAVSIWGTVAGQDRAGSTRDNVGVQYGLELFRSDPPLLSAEQFVVLNEQVGGANADVEPTDVRSVADATALEIAYRSGIVLDGKQLAKTPIIDMRGFDEAGIHLNWRSFALRARLDKANNGHGNHVMWRFPATLGPSATMLIDSLLTMDQWLMALRSSAAGSREERVVATKPTAAFDFCLLPTAPTLKETNMALCDANADMAFRKSPRQIAGGPLAENIFKCQLKPLLRADYARLNDGQFTRLAAVFPTGVCDWSKPGVGQQDAISPLDFSSGPGGTALPAAPTSVGF